MDFTNMSIKQFIQYIITFENVDNILDQCPNQSIKGSIYERLFDISIKFGKCSHFPNTEFYHILGNANKKIPKILTNYNQYLNKKVISGNSSGCSDITLKNKTNDSYIFISSKYPKTPLDVKGQKNIDYYDVEKIVSMATNSSYIYQDYIIYLVVPDKCTVLKKLKKSAQTSTHISTHINEKHMLDKTDLNKYFSLLKMDIVRYNCDIWTDIYLNAREKLELHFHQHLIVGKTSDLIDSGNKTFLWGCKCRSGKTFLVAGIILEQFKIKQKLNILVITPAPTETLPQFVDDLFNKFIDFDTFKIHSKDTYSLQTINDLEVGDNNIFVMSKQLLQKYISTNTIKPLKEWNIIPQCQMYWDVEDEQICKRIRSDPNNLVKLQTRHGEKYVMETIRYYEEQGIGLNDIFDIYQCMPDLHLITNMFDQQLYEMIKDSIMGTYYSFSFDALFSLVKSKVLDCNQNRVTRVLKSNPKIIIQDDPVYTTEEDYGGMKFEHVLYVKKFLRYISESDIANDFKTGDKSIFTRINKLCSRPPYVQIWFLPSANIGLISENLRVAMLEDLVLREYRVMCINRSNTNPELVKDVRDEIIKQEAKARALGNRGLILLAGNMC